MLAEPTPRLANDEKQQRERSATEKATEKAGSAVLATPFSVEEKPPSTRLASHALEERLFSPPCMNHMKTLDPEGGRQRNRLKLIPAEVNGVKTLDPGAARNGNMSIVYSGRGRAQEAAKDLADIV